MFWDGPFSSLAAVIQIRGGPQVALAEAPWIGIAIVLAVPALWQLHQQAAL
jgi:hypothetical protein